MPSSEFRESDGVGGRSTRAWEDRVLLPVVLAREALKVLMCAAEWSTWHGEILKYLQSEQIKVQQMAKGRET